MYKYLGTLIVLSPESFFVAAFFIKVLSLLFEAKVLKSL